MENKAGARDWAGALTLAPHAVFHELRPSPAGEARKRTGAAFPRPARAPARLRTRRLAPAHFLPHDGVCEFEDTPQSIPMKKRTWFPLGMFLVLSLTVPASSPGEERKPPLPTSRLNAATSAPAAVRPDIKIEEVWIARVGTSPARGSDARLTGPAPFDGDIRLACRLKNVGADLKVPFAVTYLVDGNVVGRQQFPGLASGRTTLSAVSYRARAAGPHRLRCDVDREKMIVEATRDNNALEIAFAVARGPVLLNNAAAGSSGRLARDAGGTVGGTTGSTPPALGDRGIDDRGTPEQPGRAGRTLPSPPGEAPPPPDEPPLASKVVSSIALAPPDVPAALNYELVIVASGSTVTFLRTADLSVVKCVSLDGDIGDQTTTVLAGTGSPATFAATAAGSVYCIDPAGGAILWQRTFRRALCTADGITARPIVHLRRNASAGFKAQHPTDLVYVATNYAATSECTSGQDTANRVYALQVTDGIPVWTYNDTGAECVDGVTRAGSLDVASDRLFIGSRRDYSAGQQTVRALDVVTGTPVWSANAGAIENTPVPLDDRVLVASRTGVVSALNRGTGGLIWKLQMGSPFTIASMTAANVPGVGRAVFLVMAGGQVRLVKDDGNSGEMLWEVSLPGGVKAKSRVCYEPDSNVLFVGADDGRVYQIDAASGTVTASRLIETSGAAIITDPFVWKAGGVAKLIAGSSKGTIAEFLLPWPAGAAGQ